MQSQNKNHCREYANCQEAVRIIRYGTESEKAKLFECLKLVFANLFIALSRYCHITKGSLKETYAEEAMNDALRIFIEQVNKEKFKSDGSAALPTYLYLLYYRCYVRIWRKESRIPIQQMNEAFIQSQSIIASSNDIPGNAQKKIAFAMSSCGPECENILTLTYLMGQNTQEIAMQLNMPLQTVKNRLVICRKKLRTIINNF